MSIKIDKYVLLPFFFILFGTELAVSQKPDSLILESIVQNADDIPTVRSLIIQQKGNVLAAEGFDDRDLNHPFNIKSASKSIIGLLTGIALEKGFIPSIDEPIKTYFPDYFDEHPDSLKESITIRNLLSMQAGLRSTSSRNYGAWVISDNWIEFALGQNFTEDIGGTMVYSTGISHLLSVIISKASDMTTKAFAEEYLFNAMNIRIGGWDKDPQGYYMGGNNLSLKPTDLLKIGQLILDNGVYNSKQLVSPAWIQESFKTYTFSNFNPYGYGYQWWNQEIGGHKTFFAWGNGGQYIFIIPELDAVVVLTSSTLNTSSRRSYKDPIFTLLSDEIIPFLENR
tara:strand:+ start:5644 stop:6663 length:1020 start_codon:yes stop_codon:yes gene_type:complete